MIRMDFDPLVEKYINNDIDAKRALNTLLFKRKSPHLSADEISYLTNMLSNEIENAATLTLKASLYHTGQGYSLNYSEAIRLYEQAIALGDATAMGNRAFMHQHGQGGIDRQPAVLGKYYEGVVAEGSTTAVDNLANIPQRWQTYILQEGHRTIVGEPDYPAAIHLYQQAMALGNTTAMNSRALMHKSGHGEVDGMPNYPAAINLFEQAIALDDTIAMNNRAIMYQLGQGEVDGKPNYPAAISLFEQAIALGDTMAVNNRAFMHKNGSGEIDDKPNYPAAIRLLEQEIALGNKMAIYIRAQMFQYGEGEINNKPNLIQAAKLLRQAGCFGNEFKRLLLKSDDLCIKYHYVCSRVNDFTAPSFLLFLQEHPLAKRYLIEDALIHEEAKEFVFIALMSMNKQPGGLSISSSSTLRLRFFKPAIEASEMLCKKQIDGFKSGKPLKLD